MGMLARHLGSLHSYHVFRVTLCYYFAKLQKPMLGRQKMEI